MLAIPLFGDQPSNAYRIQEGGIGLSIHFREEPITAKAVKESLSKIVGNKAHEEALDRQYIINARSGGASKAADYVEDMMLLGHLDHLIPVTEDVPFYAKINLDLYLLFLGALLVVLFGMFKVVRFVLSFIFGGGSKAKKD
jgi:hypothetical protein